MTLTNHALTGAIIGLIVGQPLIAIPAAFASHFVCDALPHFGRGDSVAVIGGSGFKRYLIGDISMCLLLVFMLALLRPEHWLLASFCAFLATLPDSFWFAGYRRTLHGKAFKHPKRNLFLQFAGNIQWFERPIGAVVEAAWFTAGIIIIAQFV